VKLQEGALAASEPCIGNERALTGVAPPDGAFDVARNVTGSRLLTR